MTLSYNKCILIYLSCSIFCVIETLSMNVATTIPPKVEDVLKNVDVDKLESALNHSRRIIGGIETFANRPYMVYLKLPTNSAKYNEYRRWLCGGVIVHEEYILTSAACIEDAKHFYVVSGTSKHSPVDDRYSNECIKNGAKKAVWKCIPRNYVFDGHENDNLRWMNNDIAIVKVEDEFDFSRRIKGCEYVPRPICYNNQSSQLEAPGTVASIAGWGSTEKYNDWVNSRKSDMVQNLLEANVRVISKKRCKRRWGRRYHNIIDNYMICSKDLSPDLSEICQEKYADCTDIMYSGSEEDARKFISPSELVLHSAYHNETNSRRQERGAEGFCENDHGGPLVYGSGVNAVVIGIISACLVKERTNKCYGPFLYTSVYKNRVLINCAIYKDHAGDCSKLFRASETHEEFELSWVDHPDGPAKNELARMRRAEENQSNITTINVKNKEQDESVSDRPEQHAGVIFRVNEIKSNNNQQSNTTLN